MILRIVPYVELLTFSPCREGNPPVPGNRAAKVTLIIYWQSAKWRRESASTCACSPRARTYRTCASVRVFTGRTSERRGRSLTNIGFTHWKQPPLTFPPHTYGISPADITAAAFLRSERKITPTLSLRHTFFWILLLFCFSDFNA